MNQQTPISKTLETQLRYGFEAYSRDTDDVEVDIENVKRLFRKISYLYALATGGYWESFGEAVISTALDDESIGIDMYYQDATAIAGIMSCVPSLLLILMKFINEVDHVELTNEDLKILESLESMRGKLTESSFIEFQELSKVIHFPENVIK